MGGPVTEAKLRFRVGPYWLSDVWVYRICNPYWSESTLTWENWQAQTGGPCGPEIDTLYALAPYTWYEVEVTGQVAGNGWVSFGLSTDSNGAAWLYSRESGLGPELVVTYQP